MKTLFISLAAMCILFSQNNSAFGLRTSLNMTSYNGNDLLDMGVTTGFAAGAWYSHPLSENWSVLAELNISFRGGLGIGPAVDTLGYNITAELEDKLTFLEIPVSFILKSSDNVWFGVGPYFAYLLNARRESIFTYPGRQFIDPKVYSASDLNTSDINQSEFGIIFTILFKIGEFDLSTRYMLGFTEITTFDPGSFDLSSNNLQFGFGIRF